ncbi:MAG: hypothetical protein FWG87_01400 [Defluviitaleaceae bacterium]|nr:hypothetical protein [Defluviitaleaceae bacterium]
MEQASKKLSFVLSVVAMLAVVGFVFCTNVQYAEASSVDGNFTVSGPFLTAGMDTALNTLSERIAVAENLINTTLVAPNGSGIPPANFWAPQAAHTALNASITSAKAMVNSVSFKAGDTFDVTVSVAGNTGFAALLLHLQMPDELEVIAVKQGLAHNGFDVGGTGIEPGDWNYTTGALAKPISPNIFAGYSPIMAGTSVSNFTGNGVLFTYTMRVKSGAAAGITEAATVKFSGSQPPYTDNPTKVVGADNLPLSLTMNGSGILTPGQVVTLGNVLIVN